MKPRTIGRTLGIGLRVAGRVVGQRVAEGGTDAGVATPTRAAAQPAEKARVADAGPGARAAGKAVAQAVKPNAKSSANLGRGVAGFVKPFQRVGGILWLEVTGVFFLLFVVVFAPTVWKTRASMVQGPDHRTFWSAAAIMVVFLYLSVTSFWKARRR
jgi:hypothetical protein